VKCSTGAWLILDIYTFALPLFNKASGLLYRLLLVTDKHRQLTDCITEFGSQKWDADHNLKKISEIMSLHRLRHGHGFLYTILSRVHYFGVRHSVAWIIIIMTDRTVHVPGDCHDPY
jgi:hypothetical protein